MGYTHTQNHTISKREENKVCKFTEYGVSTYYVPVIELNAEKINQIN